MISGLKASVTSILAKLISLTFKVNAIVSSITFCSNNIGNFDDQLDTQNLNLSDFTKRFSKLDGNYNNLQIEIDNLKLNFDITKQNSFINIIEIIGNTILLLLFTTNETLIDILIILSKKLNVNLNVTDASYVYRTKA